MRDAVVVTMLSGAAAAWVTSHLSIAFGLTARPPRWRGAVAVVVPPLAVLWAYREGLLIRATINVVSVLVYFVSLLLARR